MTTQLSSLRVSAQLDTAQYTSAMAQKVAADKQGEASSVAVGQALARQDVATDELGRGVARLSRTYIEGYGSTARFERELRVLETGLSTGALTAARATAVYDGLVRKFRQVGDAAAIARRGSADLAAIVANGPSASIGGTARGAAQMPGNDNSPRPVFRRDQYMNLSYQANDIATGLMSGMPIGMIAAQQSGQLMQILQGAEGGVTAGLKSLGGTLMGLVNPITATVAALGVAGIALKAFAGAAAEIGEVAKRVQLDTGRYQALRGAAYVGGGVDSETFQTGLSSVGQKANTEFRNGEGELTKLLEANNRALTDRAGRVKDVNGLLMEAATLVAGANNEFDKIDILKLFGLTDNWLKLLEKGPAELQRLQGEVANSGTIINAELIQRAHAFDLAWSQGWRNFALNAKSAATTAGSYLAALSNAIDVQQKKNDRLSDVGAMLGRAGAPGANGKQAVDTFFTPAPPIIDPAVTALPGGRTTVPSSKGAGRKRGGPKTDEFDGAVKRQETSTRQIESEIQTYGQAADVVARYKVETELLAAAKRADKAITPELTERVKQLADAHGKATADMAKLRQESQSSVALQGYVGQELMGIFDSVGKSGTTAISTLENLAKSLSKVVLQAALMGTGPLGSLFGGQTNGSGGLIGSLVSALGGGTTTKSANGNVMTEYGPLPLQKYANGGIARSPQLSIFGEGRLPEAYVPLPDGRSIPVTMRAPAPVAIPTPAQPARNSGGGVTSLTINEASGQKAQVSQDEDGNLTIDMIADQMEARMAGRASRGRGPMGQILGGAPASMMRG